MLTKNQHCLESILEATDRIIEYTYGIKSADDSNYEWELTKSPAGAHQWVAKKFLLLTFLY